ncbi:hypothetical protein V492_07510 [Pseudogymnoascus sp. VKM F-4246]|nr:hypothetical protein V492_07510 [Pseudogymnoascus sp. VKM F-4246]
MGASVQPDNSYGAYAPVDTPLQHATAATNRARPHPAFLTDEGPTLFVDTLGNILTRRAPTVRMICYIGAILLTTDVVALGLTANASSNVDSTETASDVDPAGIIIDTIAGFAEVTLFAIMSFCFLFWNWHLAYFLSITLIGISALGTGAYGMAIMAISMSNSVCADKGSCEEALKKGMAGACIRVLLTAPFCLTLTFWYFVKARREVIKFKAGLQGQLQTPLRRLDDGHDLEPLRLSGEGWSQVACLSSHITMWFVDINDTSQLPRQRPEPVLIGPQDSSVGTLLNRLVDLSPIPAADAAVVIMSINPQSRSAFDTSFITLPPEIRYVIYLEMWRSHGLRQHITWHDRDQNAHFCSWPCTTEYEVEDKLQHEIEELRRQKGVPLGQNMGTHWQPKDPEITVLTRHLQSTWYNHWACHKRALDKHGFEVNYGFSTSRTECWKKARADENEELVPAWSPYLPMLLSCKLISEECLKSIYESTTFIFFDLETVQMFLGHCQLTPGIEHWPRVGITPPGLFKYARSLEFSLSPDSPKLLNCTRFNLAGTEVRHDFYDFHWLRLPEFQNLESINIWISARSLIPSAKVKDPHDFTGITEFDVDALQQVLAHLDPVANVTLSTPLGPSVGPEEGYVEGFKARVYKRGSGDTFHPMLYPPLEQGGTYDCMIHTAPNREVRLLTNNGAWHLVMRSV